METLIVLQASVSTGFVPLASLWLYGTLPQPPGRCTGGNAVIPSTKDRGHIAAYFHCSPSPILCNLSLFSCSDAGAVFEIKHINLYVFRCVFNDAMYFLLICIKFVVSMQLSSHDGLAAIEEPLQTPAMTPLDETPRTELGMEASESDPPPCTADDEHRVPVGAVSSLLH